MSPLPYFAPRVMVIDVEEQEKGLKGKINQNEVTG